MALHRILGSFCSIATSRLVRQGLRSLSQRSSTAGIPFAGFNTDSFTEDTSPRSLSGCDILLEPKILKDFPDFDFTLAKTYVRDALDEKYKSNNGFTVHNVVIARYLPSAVQKTIVYQAAGSYRENGQLQQKRYTLHYTYILPEATRTIAANCPNCGGVLGYGETVCSFCDSRVVHGLGSAWRFTEIKES